MITRLGDEMKKILLAAGAIVMMAVPAKAANLTAEQMQKAFVGKRITYETADGFKGSARYNKNGSASLSNTKPDRFKDKGTWRIKGNSFCNKWEVVRDGRERCFTYVETGKGRYLSNTGTAIKAGRL